MAEKDVIRILIYQGRSLI